MGRVGGVLRTYHESLLDSRGYLVDLSTLPLPVVAALAKLGGAFAAKVIERLGGQVKSSLFGAESDRRFRSAYLDSVTVVLDLCQNDGWSPERLQTLVHWFSLDDIGSEFAATLDPNDEPDPRALAATFELGIGTTSEFDRYIWSRFIPELRAAIVDTVTDPELRVVLAENLRQGREQAELLDEVREQTAKTLSAADLRRVLREFLEPSHGPGRFAFEVVFNWAESLGRYLALLGRQARDREHGPALLPVIRNAVMAIDLLLAEGSTDWREPPHLFLEMVLRDQEAAFFSSQISNIWSGDVEPGSVTHTHVKWDEDSYHGLLFSHRSVHRAMLIFDWLAVHRSELAEERVGRALKLQHDIFEDDIAGLLRWAEFSDVGVSRAIQELHEALEVGRGAIVDAEGQ